MKWALVENDVVVAISYTPDRDEDGDVLPVWVEVGDGVFAGFIREEDGSFAAPDGEGETDPGPIDTRPSMVACALRVPVEDDVVQVIGGSFRIAAMMFLDTGTFLAIFSQNLGETSPYVIPNNGVSVSIAEWGGDYATIEIRDHAGGTLITPASFGFSLYNF